MHVGSSCGIRLLQAGPILPAQCERHPWEAVGAVHGSVGVDRLGTSQVSRRHALIQQGPRYHILADRRERDTGPLAGQTGKTRGLEPGGENRKAEM